MTETVSNPFRLQIVAPGSGTPPAWALAQPVGQWYTVPNTAQSLLKEPTTISTAPAGGKWQAGNTSARLNAWCGPSFRTRGSILLLGPCGGHGDYFSNWMSQVVLGTENPYVEVLDIGTHWTELYNDSTHMGHAGAIRPCATHSYYSHVFCDQRDWLLYFGVTALGATAVNSPPANWAWRWPGTHKRIAAYDYNAKQWLDPATVPDMPLVGSSNVIAAPHAIHPATGDVYYGQDGDVNFGFYRWNQTSNTQTVVAQAAPVNYQATAIDAKRNRMFFSGAGDIQQSNYKPRVIDCASGVATQITLTGPSAAIVQQNDATYGNSQLPAYPAMLYVSSLDKYIFAISNRSTSKVELFQTDASTFECMPYSTTGAQPTMPVNGIQTKLQFARELRGVVLMNRYDEGVKYLRLW